MSEKISLCMIVKDEEAVLARCLESVKNFVDEIIVADTGSADRTVEIAKRYTDKVFHFAWTDDFSAARNFSFSKATSAYLLWLDADDVVSSKDGEKLVKLKTDLEIARPDVVMCRYDVEFNAKDEPTYSYFRERILRRDSKPQWQGCVHECIQPKGKVIKSDFSVQHRKTGAPRGSRNLDIYRKNIFRGYLLNSRDKFYYGRELYYNRLYTEAAAVLTEMINDASGWYVNKIEACKILSACYRAQNLTEKALEALFSGFRYAEPRASALCEIGNLFKTQKAYEQAVFWYKAALSCRSHTEEGDFDRPQDRGIVPLIELTCCCFLAGDVKSAVEYHKRAAALDKTHPSVVHNENFSKVGD